MAIKKSNYSSLKAWRAAHEWDQRTAAKRLEISQAYYSNLEAGRQVPRREILKRIAERTGVPLDALVGIAS